MRIKVTKDTVKIVDDNYVVNKGEYNVNKCEFEFTEEYTEDLIKKAIFVNGETKKEMAIINNECDIPQEVLNSNSFELRVYAYEVDNNELVLRYSPTYTYAYLREGSYLGGATPSEKITPSQFQQYEQALHEGLQDVNDELDLVEEKLVETETLNIEGSKEGHTTTITITGRDGSTNSINIYDGEKGDTGEPGPKGEPGTPGVPGEKGETGYYFTPSVNANGDLSWTNNGDLENPTTVNIKGPKGDAGPKGDTGVQGPQGLQGPKGDIGATGPQGPAGQDGVTPVKGVDYFTTEDIAEIEGDIEEIIGDLQDLDTTDKTDIVSAINEVASSAGGGGDAESLVYWLEIDNNSNVDWNGKVNLSNNDLTKMSEIIKKAYDSEQNFFNLIVTAANRRKIPVTFNYGRDFQNLQDKPTNMTMFSVASDNPITNSASYLIYSLMLYISISWNDTVPTVISGFIKTEKSQYLSRTNTSPYEPTPNSYNPATTKYVDDAVASAGGGGDILVYSLISDTTSNANWNGTQRFTNTDKTKLTEIIQEVYNNGYNTFDLIVTSSNNQKAPLTFNYGRPQQNIQSKPTRIILSAIISDNRITDSSAAMIFSIDLVVDMTWDGNTVTVENALTVTDKTTYLSTTNTNYYIPTSNYHPATKKYVDDSIASAITTTLGGSY